MDQSAPTPPTAASPSPSPSSSSLLSPPPVSGSHHAPSENIRATNDHIHVVANFGEDELHRYVLRRVEEGMDEAYLSSLRTLLHEYIAQLGIDMTFQNVDQELAELPGSKYTASKGGFLYALEQHPKEESAAAPTYPPQLVGCICLKDLGDGISEAKRLFVRPAWRGYDFGRVLLVHILDVARQAGYSTLRLDTLARFTAANALYAKLGFNKIPPYNFNPQDDVLYFELDGLQHPDRAYEKGREEHFKLTTRPRRRDGQAKN